MPLAQKQVINLEPELADLFARVGAIESHLATGVSFSSPGSSTNATVTLQTKVSGTTPILPTGFYLWMVSCAYNYDVGNSSIFAEFTVDGLPLAGTNIVLKAEPKDSGGNVGQQTASGMSGSGSDERYPFMQAWIAEYTTEDTHDALLQFRAEVAGVEATLADATVVVKRLNFP